jgi:hypothetical protein
MQQTLTFADIQRTKRHAKKIKTTFPELPLGRRLDHAASELFGVRNYHELTTRFHSVLDQHVVTPDDGRNSISCCLYCDFSFAADEPQDVRQHREIHQHVMEAVESLGYQPAIYVRSEIMKRSGYDLADHGTDNERVDGLLLICRAWFDNSLMRAMQHGYWREHPDFAAYVAMMVPHLRLVFPERAQTIEDLYGVHEHPIGEGKTKWFPARRS